MVFIWNFEPKHDLIVVPVQKIAAISPQIVTFIENTDYVRIILILIGITPRIVQSNTSNIKIHEP